MIPSPTITKTSLVQSSNMLQLPCDFFHALLEHIEYSDLLSFLDIEEHRDKAERELRKRVHTLKFKPHQSPSHNLSEHLLKISPFARRLKINFNFYGHAEQFASTVFQFLNTCKTYTELQFENLPKWLMLTDDLGRWLCDLSRVRTLSLAGYSTNHRRSTILRQMLESCSADRLRELELHKCLESGENLACIPGQLERLSVENVEEYMFQWQPLYVYLERCPMLAELAISNRVCFDPLDLAALCAHLQHARVLKLHNNSGQGLLNWGALGSLHRLRDLDIEVDGDGLASFLFRLTGKHQLTRLRLVVSNFEFTESNAAPLTKLDELRELNVCVGQDTLGLVELLRTVRGIPSVRRLALVPGRADEGDGELHQTVTVGDVVDNLQQLEHLHIGLVPIGLSRMAELKNLKSLHLCILNPANMWEKLKGNVNEFVESIGRFERLHTLRLESTEGGVYVKDRSVEVGFGGGGRRLHTLELRMNQYEIGPFRGAKGKVKDYRELPPARVDSDDGEWSDLE